MNRQHASHEDGATAVEYALLLSLIFMVVIGAVGLLGTTLAGTFANAAALV